jgi:hypothetical protein
MQKMLGRTFLTIVRPLDEVAELVASDPYAGFRLPRAAKRVVTFLRERPGFEPKLPVERDGASILRLDGLSVFSAYVPGPRGPVFMQLIEKTFGTELTTRTFDTVSKVARS